jgi:hypothetical protein
MTNVVQATDQLGGRFQEFVFHAQPIAAESTQQDITSLTFQPSLMIQVVWIDGLEALTHAQLQHPASGHLFTYSPSMRLLFN